MLYVTTRDSKDAYTAHRALCENYGPDGGRYVPFSLPAYTQEEITQLKEKSFSQIVAELINLFFSSRLTSWDVDFCIGRNPIRLLQMNHRAIVAELWHNLDGKYAYIVNNLYAKISDTPGNAPASDWSKIAFRIAILFAVYGEILRSDMLPPSDLLDVSVLTDDFSAPMAAWYARKMGLPIGTIVCTCAESGSVWDLIHRGNFVTFGTGEALQLGIERLVHGCFGAEEAKRFYQCCQNNGTYFLSEEMLPCFSEGLFCTVAGENRAAATINSIYRTNSYIIDPTSALCFGGLQDYRARSGESRITLLLSEETPCNYLNEISDATGVTAEKIVEIVNHY